MHRANDRLQELLDQGEQNESRYSTRLTTPSAHRRQSKKFLSAVEFGAAHSISS